MNKETSKMPFSTRRMEEDRLNSNKECGNVPFDFIVVGAGSSCMGFLAGLLQANFVGTVAVIERGPGHDDDETIHNNQTAHWYRDSHHPHHRGDDSQQEQDCTILTASCWGRILRVPTGSGLGGTSRIHAGLCLAPPDNDLNHEAWPEPCRSQLPRSLDCIQQLLEQNQSLHVFHHIDQHQVAASGNKKDDDDDVGSINNRNRIRGIPCRCTVTANGKDRINYFEGLVAPLLEPPRAPTQIQWFTSCVVQNLVTDSSQSQTDEREWVVTVRGVRLWNKATQSHQVLYAKRKVILAAGVFASPTILLASGLLSNDCAKASSCSSEMNTKHTRVAEKRGVSEPRKRQQQQEQSSSLNEGVENEEQEQPWVDLPLMDHVMIPCSMFSWRPLVSQKYLSWNGVQSLHQVDYTGKAGNSTNNNGSDQNTHTNPKRFLVSRMDATVHADILPSILVDFLFRREWLPHLHWYENRADCGPRQRRLLVPHVGVVQTMFAVALHSLAISLEFMLRRAILWTPLGWILRYHVIIMSIFCMNPNTAGNKLSIRRRQPLGRIEKMGMKNPPVQVKIHLPYLKDEQDIVALQAVWQDCKQLVAPSDAIEFFPGSWIRRWGYFGLFRGYCRAFCLPFFHWCGTLPLGGSVVDRHFGVRHFESLCICDASVIPRQVSVPPALTCAALGHCLACLVLQQQSNG